MRKNIQWTWIALLTGFVMFFGTVQYARSAPPSAADPAGAVGYLENITFEKLKGKERITLMVSKQSTVNVDRMAGNGVLVKMKDVFVPEALRKPAGEGKFSNIIRVVPAQETTNGNQWAKITIDLRERVPYSINQQGANVLIDFNVAMLESKSTAETQAPSAPVGDMPAKASKPAGGEVDKDTVKTRYTGRKISLDLQDASIKAVLRLLSEEGGVTIVSGDDVKGNVTVHMKKVPWDQALDTILDINGLTKKQMGDVISVMTLEKMKKDEADRKAGEEDRAKAEVAAKKAEQERQEERGRLAQISIEAKIVEASDEFVRNIGVRWGGVGYGSMNSTGWSLMGGSNTVSTRNMTWGYPNEVPITGQMGRPDGLRMQSMAVNYPSTLASPAIGLVIGGASAVLEAQLAALETTSQGKIISSPKITTMDNVKATIKQGQEIPFVTIDKDGNRSITFKEAVLRLEVKPKITPDGKISMEIKAMNDAADYSRTIGLEGNPPINKSEVESKVVVQDGDTIVIGGILKTEDTKGQTGVPWLSKIPVLGWLFKTESTTKSRRQIMVFVTPKIIKGDAAGEIPPQQPQIKG
jgi:type IV pilus assembly protein PilQ